MNEDALTRTQRIDAYVAANAKSLKVAVFGVKVNTTMTLLNNWLIILK